MKPALGSPAFRYALELWRGDADPAKHATTIDPRDFARVLAQHRLALALPDARSIEGSAPASLLTVLRQRQRHLTLVTLSQTAALRELVHTLDTAGLPYCLLKGQGYAALFDAPQRREACDIDLLIPEDRYAAALPLLQRLGYVPDPAAAADLPRYCEANHALPLRHATTGVVLELHGRLANHIREFPLHGAVLWNAHTVRVQWAGFEVTTLAAPAAVAYAAYHGTKHNWHRAFWLVDMAHALRSDTHDWPATLTLARRLGVERQLVLGVLLAEAALGVTLPPALRGQSTLLRRVRPAAAMLLPHLDALGADRGADLAARLGLLRYARRLWSLQSTWRGRWQLLPFLLAPTPEDRHTLALPRYLQWTYPGLRAIRLLRQHAIKRRRARGELPRT